jgi:hypothetical protein
MNRKTLSNSEFRAEKTAFWRHYLVINTLQNSGSLLLSVFKSRDSCDEKISL